MSDVQEPEGSPREPEGTRAFSDITLKAKTVTRIVVGGGVLLVVLLATGIVMALLGLREVRQDIAELKQARVAPVRQARQAPPPPALPRDPISLDQAAQKGSKTARVAIVEFSDFQCPFCSRFTTNTLPELDREYISTGKVLLAFRHLPLDEIHPNARGASVAAECAGRQGKFWDMHDRLFLDPKRLAADDIAAHSKGLGLSGSAFETCLNGVGAERVALDVAEAQRLQVNGTPGFLIGTIEPDGRVKVTDRLSGAQPFSVFQPVLERLLAGTN